jgi:hypothetical protein
MTDDIVKRLRDYTCGCYNGNPKHTTWEAADHIEALQDIIAKIQYTNLRRDINAKSRTIEIEKLCKGKPNEQR